MISSDPHFYNLRKVFCLAWLLCLSQSLFAEKTELTISENSFFEIIGSDIKSTQVINELSNYVAESVLEEFSAINCSSFPITDEGSCSRYRFTVRFSTLPSNL